MAHFVRSSAFTRLGNRLKAELQTRTRSSCRHVRSSAFRRQNAVFRPNRLKAELQTRTKSSCHGEAGSGRSKNFNLSRLTSAATHFRSSEGQFAHFDLLGWRGRISISCNRIPVSLTPGFSRVLGCGNELKRFQPFPAPPQGAPAKPLKRLWPPWPARHRAEARC